MNGPDHYRVDEQLLVNAGAGTARQAYGAVQLDEPPSPFLAAAQVHATLALTAATALPTLGEFYEVAEDVQAWAEVTGVPTGNPDDDGYTCQPLDPDEIKLDRAIVDVQLPEPAAHAEVDIVLARSADSPDLTFVEVEDGNGHSIRTGQWVDHHTGDPTLTVLRLGTPPPIPLRLCIDANCPQCDWGERWFEPDRQLFGCAKCDYTSTERTA